MGATSQRAGKHRYSRHPATRPTRPAGPEDPPDGPVCATAGTNRGPHIARPAPRPPSMLPATEPGVRVEKLTPDLLRKTGPHTEPKPAAPPPPESRSPLRGATEVCPWEKACWDELADASNQHTFPDVPGLEWGI